MKVQLSINDKLMERTDGYAKKNYMKRSNLVSLALTEYLNDRETMLLVKNLSLAIGKIADSGKIDADTMEIIKDFERFSKLVIKKK
ncbi:MAG: hypothetical protein E7271_03530 [Lachnospiraceae bacterium]|jgi:metal-responsive CopG/Arc/MetJ family transcriptional regulator|nr:hypothetical protein [Lachnospiraceae bacterium]